jgi:hypothetical protein
MIKGMKPFDELREFFARSPELAAAYLYGRYAEPPTYPDSDIEVGLLFRTGISEEEVQRFLERLGEESPIGPGSGILLPTPLNEHILPVQYEQVRFGTVLSDNDSAERARFEADVHARLRIERPKLLEEAREALQQARALGEGIPVFSPLPGRTLRLVEPIRAGWRIARILSSCAVIEVATREIDKAAQDPDRVAQLVGWFGNAAGAATGIAKAMLSTYGQPRPPRRWQVFLPLGDLGILPMEQALWLAAMVETRWALLTANGIAHPERALAVLRTYLPYLLHFARVSAWATEMPEVGDASRVH